MNETLFAAVSFGFLGSLHCVGMCGGLVGALSASRKNSWKGLFLYQIGRITTYAFLGLIAGLIGVGLDKTGGSVFQTVIAVMVGLIFVGYGLNMLGLFPDPLARLTGAALRFLKPGNYAQALLKNQNLSGWIPLGLINGLLPCGLVYAALALALTAENVTMATSTMVFFGAGTIPAMMTAPAVIRLIKPRIRGNMLRFAGVLMILYGVFTGIRGSKFMPLMHNHSLNNTNPQKELCTVNEYYFERKINKK